MELPLIQGSGSSNLVIFPEVVDIAMDGALRAVHSSAQLPGKKRWLAIALAEAEGGLQVSDAGHLRTSHF